MIELTGANLCARRRELNIKINDAAGSNVDFNEIKLGNENCDVDKLFKIGVASKYKNVEYIIDTLKSGDSLYISHALKCTWLYSNEYSYIINPEYLHQNVIPMMSSKMTKKLLTTISVYINDVNALNFYNYCVKSKYTNIAMKFLISTPEAFKMKLLKDEKLLNNLKGSHEYLTLYLGDSFDLAEAYYNMASSVEKADTLYQIRHFYFKSDLKYLAMLNKFNSPLNKNVNRLGLRISRDIIRKHKGEIYKNPIIYLYLLNKTMLVQYSTIADVKFYAKALIAYECLKPTDFWEKCFCNNYKFILDKLPFDERLKFIKDLFKAQYPLEKFESTRNFYDSQLYKLMTPEEREKWALTHLESGLELLGCGNDFLWYRHVSFDNAFIAIKKYIQVTVDIEIRTKMIVTLVESAKTNLELETLFVYYYKRHVNERRCSKEDFVDAVLKEHNVYEFSECCWEKFNQILHSLEVYNVINYYASKSFYKTVALIYHIIHEKKVPDALTDYMDSGIYFYEFKTETEKITKNDMDAVYQYLLQFYLDKIKSFDAEVYNEEIKCNVRKYIHYVLDLMHEYKKSKEDIPDIVNKHIKLDLKEFQNHSLIRVFTPSIQQKDLIRYLKKDKDLIVSKLPLIKERVNSDLELNKLLKILKTYFSNDLAVMFLNMYQEILVDTSRYMHLSYIKKAVYGIFQLADIDVIIEFMAKYVPTDAKIDHEKIDEKLFHIQKSICQLACNSRYPIPLSEIMKYIKGDYVQFCLPMFNYYLAKLPKALNMELVQALLDKPLSVQKHGIHMAFQCFSTDELRKLIVGIWKKTKNVSLRWIIYSSLYKKIKDDYDESVQNLLFEDLKIFTSSVHEEDNTEILGLIISDELPKRFIGEYIEVAWNTISLSEKKAFLHYRCNMIDCMERNIHFMRNEFIESIIDDHVNYILKHGNIKHNFEHNETTFMTSKWNLFHKYVTYFTDDDNYRKKTEIVMAVITESLKLWNKVDSKKYVVKELVSTFIKDMNEKSYNHDVSNFTKANKLFELILKKIQESVRHEEIYIINWLIRVSNLTRNVLADVNQKFFDDDPLIKIDKAINAFVKEFNNLFIEFVKNGQCYVTLFNNIENICEMNLNEILIYFKFDGDSDSKLENAYILLCSKLIEYKSFETYMFASNILPCDIQNSPIQEEFINVYNKLKCYENNEVQCFLYTKCVTNNNYTDYTVS